MGDREEVEGCYRTMYDGMVLRSRALLESVLSDSFVLVHMTGMRQSRERFVASVLDGTLNYYSADHRCIDARIDGDTAALTGLTLVEAAVFGGGRGTWRLRLDLELSRRGGRWVIDRAQASTYRGDGDVRHGRRVRGCGTVSQDMPMCGKSSRCSGAMMDGRGRPGRGRTRSSPAAGAGSQGALSDRGPYAQAHPWRMGWQGPGALWRMWGS